MSKQLATSMEFGDVVLKALKIDHLSVRSIKINIEPSDFIEAIISINIPSDGFEEVVTELSAYKLSRIDAPT